MWYIHNPSICPKNDMHKIFWNFEIETDHRITGPLGIRAVWGIKVNDRFEGEWPLVPVSLPLGG